MRRQEVDDGLVGGHHYGRVRDLPDQLNAEAPGNSGLLVRRRFFTFSDPPPAS